MFSEYRGYTVAIFSNFFATHYTANIRPGYSSGLRKTKFDISLNSDRQVERARTRAARSSRKSFAREEETDKICECRDEVGCV